MAQKPLDVGALKGLLAQEEKREQQQIATKIRNKNFPTEPRDFDTWFKLPTRFADCHQADECIDPRVDRTKTGHTMVAMVNGSEICRYCFLAGANKVST
jgi:hypothetical protein